MRSTQAASVTLVFKGFTMSSFKKLCFAVVAFTSVACTQSAEPAVEASTTAALTGACSMTVTASYPGEDMWITNFRVTAVCGNARTGGEEVDVVETSNGWATLENLKCDCRKVTVESLEVWGGKKTVRFSPSRDLSVDGDVAVELPLPD